MSSSDYVYSSEEDDMKAGRAMVRAALDVLMQLGDEESDELMRCVVKALIAASTESVKQYTYYRSIKLGEKNDQLFVANWATAADATATAFYIWLTNCNTVDDCHPICVAGQKLLKFASGIMAADKVSNALDLMDELLPLGHRVMEMSRLLSDSPSDSIEGE